MRYSHIIIGFVAVLGAVALVACEPPASKRIEDTKTQYIDQCARERMFKDCLQAVPKGPDTIVDTGNSWHKVVEECSSTAYYQAIRQGPSAAMTKPECRVER